MKLKFSLLFSCILLFSCSKDGDFNVFSVEDDIEFGRELDASILANPTEYPILPLIQYPEAYDYVDGILYSVLSSDEILHKDEFPWQIRIINKDVLNAFAAPGGFLYVYTGFIKYAASEAELAGVIAHEIAHSDLRHSTEVLTKQYGLTTLLSILVGSEGGQIKEIASQLALNSASLKFSRKNEYEADEHSVRYLNSISSIKKYDATSIMDFFDRMQEDSLSQANGRFEFLRTHPYDDNRKENVNKIWSELGSPAGEKFVSEHQSVVDKLP